MHVVLTGGAGYVGSRLCRDLLLMGDRVTVIDTLCYGASSVKGFLGWQGFRFVKEHVAEVEALPDDTDVIIHLAAIVGEKACTVNEKEAHYTNVVGTRNMVLKASVAHVPIIFASTCSNYGVLDPGTIVATEETPLNPQSFYAETKIEAEEAVLSYAKGIVVRAATVFGLSPRMRFDLLLHDMLRHASTRTVFRIRNPQARRPFIEIGQLCWIYRWLAQEAWYSAHDLTSDLASGQLFNVVQMNLTKTAAIRSVSASAGLTVEESEYIFPIEDGVDDPRDYAVDGNKLRRCLNVNIDMDLQTLEEYLAQILSMKPIFDCPIAHSYEN